MEKTFKCLHCEAEHLLKPNEDKTGIDITLTKAGKELKEPVADPEPKKNNFIEILFGTGE